MVTSVTTNDVTAILISKTSHVADLKKKFTLGSIGYNLFKLFSCFLSNSNPTKQAIKNAETIDKMPAQIKKTAEKIVKILKQGEFSPAIIESRAELLMPKEEALKMSGATVKAVNRTNQLQDLMGKFTSQAAKLSSAYGHGVASTGAYVEALSGLLKKDGPCEISGQNFLQLSAIQSQTKAFAQKGVGAVATNLEGFINELKIAFPKVDHDFITTHVYRQLCESGVSKEVEAYVNTYSPANAEKLAETENKPERAQINEILANFDSKKMEIYSLRGPNGNDGMIHNAWIEYMENSCRYTLEANSITSNPDAKLKPEEEKLLNDCISHKDTLRNVLNKQEGQLHEIFSRPGFNTININADEEISSNIFAVNKKLLSLKAEKRKSHENYKQLDARLKELVGGERAPEFKDTTVKAGNIEITSIMNRETEEAIQKVVTQMDDKAQKVARSYAEKTAQALSLEEKLVFAKESLFPSYARRAEENYPFATFASAVASK